MTVARTKVSNSHSGTIPRTRIPPQPSEFSTPISGVRSVTAVNLSHHPVRMTCIEVPHVLFTYSSNSNVQNPYKPLTIYGLLGRICLDKRFEENQDLPKTYIDQRKETVNEKASLPQKLDYHRIMAALLFVTAFNAPVASASSNFNLEVRHLINGNALGFDRDLPVDVYINGNLAIPDFRFDSYSIDIKRII